MSLAIRGWLTFVAEEAELSGIKVTTLRADESAVETLRRGRSALAASSAWLPAPSVGLAALIGVAALGLSLPTVGSGTASATAAVPAYGAAPLGTIGYPVQSDPGLVRYLATNGNDANAGTSAAPWRTLAHATKNAPVGGTLILKGGTYGKDQPLASVTKRLTIQPAGGATVWLSGSDVATNWEPVVEAGKETLWKSTGWTTNFSHAYTEHTVDLVNHKYPSFPEMVFIEGVAQK